MQVCKMHWDFEFFEKIVYAVDVVSKLMLNGKMKPHIFFFLRYKWQQTKSKCWDDIDNFDSDNILFKNC